MMTNMLFEMGGSRSCCFVSPILQSVDVLWDAFTIVVSVVHLFLEGEDDEGVKAA